MASLKIVLLVESDFVNSVVPSSCKYYGEKLWETIQKIMTGLNHSSEIVELGKLDFQEDESVHKFLNADIVIMDVTNQDRRGMYMYHKGTRENVDCMDDIVLVQASDAENDNTIRYIKKTCSIKHFINYRYNEEKKVFNDVTNLSTNPSLSLKKSLKIILREATNNMRKGLSDRYFSRLEKRKSIVSDNKSEREYIWKNICDEILTKTNQEYATPKLITQLMYAFRDMQDYQSMIKLSERCEENKISSAKIQNNMRISYLTAFARSRRNVGDDREKALGILQSLCQTNKTEMELSNDITCLCGRIYKDLYIESNCQDKDPLEKALDWYRRGFAADPNVYAGINLLFCMAITTVDMRKDTEANNIIMQLNALLGKKARSIKDFSDYWDVAAYFELNVIQHDWLKACQCASHMYLLNPPIWYLKSTINNVLILHRATKLRGQSNSRDHTPTLATNEDQYSFWIDFFSDAIKSNSIILEERELPAQIPILILDNYQKNDETTVNHRYIEAHLQLNFHTGDEHETLVIRTLEEQNRMGGNELGKKIDMTSIRSIIDVKRDNRSIFLYAYENSQTFLSLELQICFPSVERRTAFNEKMSKYRIQTVTPEAKLEIDVEFVRDSQDQRKVLGQGTYGKVYEAQCRTSWRKFAVKEIRMRDPSYTECLENEIKILSTLNHKNIVSYHGSAIDSTRAPATFQVIMEYVDGGSLSKHIVQSRNFSEETIINYTRQILEGVQYLHENRIVHRDIKSANILINSRGEIKIADFGTSKRLAGLDGCTETVGTPHYMPLDVFLVPPMGYGPEVDIWSVGCTVIEMITGKKPFHNLGTYQLMFKLANKELPEIPTELSDTAKDFLAKCFETTVKRPTAKDLLNHPFLKPKTGLTRDISGNHINDRVDGTIRVTNSSSTLYRSLSEDADMVFEPTSTFESQVSVDDSRRSKLTYILRDVDSREALIDQWMSLIEEKYETTILDTKKLIILLDAICDYLDRGNENSLKQALDQICTGNLMTSDSPIHLERSCYLFTKAANNILVSRHVLSSHVLFALNNLIRRIAEHLVGLIRPDFRPAENNMIPLTPNHDSESCLSSTYGVDNDQVIKLHKQYRTLAERNRERLYRLIGLESNNEVKLVELLDNQQDNSANQTVNFFLPTVPVRTVEEQNSSILIPKEQTNGHRETPVSSGVKRSRELFELEEEHERLLNVITNNRTRINEILHS